MKKGILFTLGLFFLVATVFSLALVLFHGMLNSEDVLLRFASLDRAYEIDVSLQNSLKQIFNSKSGMAISLTDSTASFQDYLPNPNKGQLASALNIFESYIESNTTNIDLDTDKIMTNTSFVIWPYNITYRHLSFGDNISYVFPSKECNLTSYEIFLHTGKINVTGIEWDSSSSGSLYFEVTASDNSGNSYIESSSIDGSSFNLLSVSTLAGDIKIKIWNSSFLSINNTAALNLSARTDLAFDSLPDSENEIILSGEIINIDFSDFGIKKKSGVRLI